LQNHSQIPHRRVGAGFHAIDSASRTEGVCDRAERLVRRRFAFSFCSCAYSLSGVDRRAALTLIFVVRSPILRRLIRHALRATALLLACWFAPRTAAAAATPAFPGAVGQGATATGGRGSDVYHVISLADYNPAKNEVKIVGSLRHAIRSAKGPRTIVFDVGGAIAQAAPLEVQRTI
jgi:hypothetical protein